MEDLISQTNQEKIDALEYKDLTDAEKLEVRELFLAEPGLTSQHSCLEDWAREKALSVINPHTVQYIAIEVGLNQMREEILSAGDSPLERMFVEQIITNHVLTATSGYEMESTEFSKETRYVSTHLVNTHDRAQKRLMKAVMALQRLRNLNVDRQLREFKMRR